MLAAYTGRNCVVTIKYHGVGEPNYVGASIENRGGPVRSDGNVYRYYAPTGTRPRARRLREVDGLCLDLRDARRRLREQVGPLPLSRT